MSYTIPTIDWSLIAPVLIVIMTGVVTLLIEMFRPKQNNNPIVIVSLIGLVLAAGALILQLDQPVAETFSGMVLRDQAGVLFQIPIVAVCALAFMFSEGYLRQKRIAFGEFYPLALWATAGAMVMVSTSSLLMIFIGLEVLSIALYCLAGMSRQEAKSEESAIKYFLLGSFASAFLLYGIAFMYGASGSVGLKEITKVLVSGNPTSTNLAIFGLGMILVGLGFKTALVPFHQWTPDVYQGAPTNVTALMAGVSKIAAFGALYRVLAATTSLIDIWFPLLFWVSIATMTVGNLVALAQKDVKRALGYSSIAHAGYILVALLAHFKRPDVISLSSTLFYLMAYVLATVGAFAVVSLTAKDGKEGTRYQDLNGLWKRAPFAAGSLMVFMASLMGMPPTPGFMGKFFIFGDAVQVGLLPLAIALAFNSIISGYYYWQIARSALVDDDPALRTQTGPVNFGLSSTFYICVIGSFVLTLAVSPFMNSAKHAGSEVAVVESDATRRVRTPRTNPGSAPGGTVPSLMAPKVSVGADASPAGLQ